MELDFILIHLHFHTSVVVYAYFGLLRHVSTGTTHEVSGGPLLENRTSLLIELGVDHSAKSKLSLSGGAGMASGVGLQDKDKGESVKVKVAYLTALLRIF